MQTLPAPNKWPEAGMWKNSSARLLCLLKLSYTLEGCRVRHDSCGAENEPLCHKGVDLSRAAGLWGIHSFLCSIWHPFPAWYSTFAVNRLKVNPLQLNSPSLWSPMQSWRLLPLPTYLLFRFLLLQLWKRISSTETPHKISFLSVRKENWCWPSLNLNWPVIKRRCVVLVIFKSDMLTNF